MAESAALGVQEVQGDCDKQPVTDEASVLSSEYRQILGENEEEEKKFLKCQSLEDLRQTLRSSPPIVALCLSGGGIRSATYCLGALQALASHKRQSAISGDMSELERIHYLSTVSGGGYIGGWLSALLARNGHDVHAVASKLARPAPAAPVSEDTVDPVAWLRQYTNYLAPKRGWSGDTWSVIALYLRHLLINWLVTVPLILGLLLLPVFHLWLLQTMGKGIPWIAIETTFFLVLTARHWHRQVARKLTLDLGIAVIGCALSIWWFGSHLTDWGDILVAACFVPCALMLEWGVGTLLAAAGGRSSYEILRERLTRDGGLAIAFAIGWLALHLLVYYLPPGILHLGAGAMLLAITAGGLGGVGAAVGGYWSKLPKLRRGRLSDRATQLLLQIAAASFVVFFLGAGGALLNMATIRFFAPMSTPSQNKSSGADTEFGKARNILIEQLSRYLDEIPKTDPNPAPAKTAAEIVDEQARQQLARGVGREMERATQDQLQGVGSKTGRAVLALKGALLAAEASYLETLAKVPWTAPVVLFAFLVVIVAGMAFLGVNTFSMTGCYSARLVRAYLGASRGRYSERHPDPYTGFDPHDDIPMRETASDGKSTARETASEGKSTARLFHVINATLNLSHGSKLRWQQRKGSSFVVTPLHCGSWTLGYQPTERYGSATGVRLGDAIAISGAAVSPNMGYHTSALVSFVLAFFNARLGFWLPNPGASGQAVWGKSEPRLGDLPHIRELLTLTSDTTPFVYVSDGGHFDNLGLYEMVRRRCRTILVVDATADADYRYDDLAATIAKIRSDMGISIEFAQSPQPYQRPTQLFYRGEVSYRDADGEGAEPGVVIYVKPVLDDLAPIDVRRYAKSHSTYSDRFPHQSTADQFFNEDQFESYRMLGFGNMTRVLDAIESLEAPNPDNLVPVVDTKPGISSGPPEPRMSADGVSQWSPGSAGFGGPLAGAIRNWGTVGALALGITVGGVVGVTGTVALAPATVRLDNASVALDSSSWKGAGFVSLNPASTVPLAKDQFVHLEPGTTVRLADAFVRLDPDAKVPLDKASTVRLAENSTVPLAQNSFARVDPNAYVRLDPGSSVRIAPGTTVPLGGRFPPIQVAELPAVRIDAVQLKGLEDAFTQLGNRMKKLDETMSNIGPRRSVIEGREGAR